jgi:hypothetical protein
MTNPLNDHIHTKCARNLAFLYQFYEKEDEEVWGPVYNHCHASECMTASAGSVSLCFQLKCAMQQLKMVCICTCSSQNSKETQFFLHLHHSEFEVATVLGYGATSLSVWCSTFWPLEMRPPCCIGTSSTNHPVMCCHISEERAGKQHRKMWNWLETSQSLHDKFHTGSSQIKSLKVKYLICVNKIWHLC